MNRAKVKTQQHHSLLHRQSRANRRHNNRFPTSPTLSTSPSANPEHPVPNDFQCPPYCQQNPPQVLAYSHPSQFNHCHSLRPAMNQAIVKVHQSRLLVPRRSPANDRHSL